MAGQVHGGRRGGARIPTHVSDGDGSTARAGAIAEHKGAESGVVEAEEAAGAILGNTEGVDVKGVDARTEEGRLNDAADRGVHQEVGRDDGARRGEEEHGTRAAASTAAGVGQVADAEGAAREAGVEGTEAGQVEDRAVGDSRRDVAAQLHIDERGVADAADQEVAAAVHDDARDGRGAGVVADGDGAVDAEGLTRADGDDVVGDRVAVTDDEAAEGRAAVGEVELRDDGRTRDVAEIEHAVRVELTWGGDGDRAGAAEGDRAVAGHDVARGHDVGVGAGEDEGARVGDRTAADGADGAVATDLDDRRGADGGGTGVGVGAEHCHGAGGGEGEAGLAGAGAEGVLDRQAERRGAAGVGQDGIGRRAAVTDELAGGRGADADGEGGHGLVEATEVEDADGSTAAKGERADRESVVGAELRGAVRDDGAAGVGIGAAEGQRAAAGVADGDLGVGKVLDERAAEGDGARAGEGKRGGADRAIAHGLIARRAGGREAGEGLAEAVELECSGVAGAAEDDGIGAGPGGGGADDKGAVLDARGAGVAIAAREGERAAGRHAADEVARAVDAVGEGQAA